MAASLQSHIKLRPSPATIYATDMGALFPYVHLIMASCAMFSTRSDFLTSDICSFVCFKSPATVCSSLMTTFIVLCKAWLLVMNSSVLLYFLYGGKTFIVSSSVKDNFSRYSILDWIFFLYSSLNGSFCWEIYSFCKEITLCNNLISSFLLANLSLWRRYFAIRKILDLDFFKLTLIISFIRFTNVSIYLGELLATISLSNLYSSIPCSSGTPTLLILIPFL